MVDTNMSTLSNIHSINKSIHQQKTRESDKKEREKVGWCEKTTTKSESEKEETG